MLQNRQKGKRNPEKGGMKPMTGTIVFGILGYITMILGIFAQAILRRDPGE